MKARQKGVAVVLAMGVVAMAATAAVAIMVAQSTWARRSELAADHAQAQALVQAGVDWTRAVLSDDRRTGNVDHLGEPWALRLPAVSIEKGEVAGHIEDQEGLINLNNLVQDGKLSLVQLGHFRRLLSILGLPAALADALVDWVDADSQPQGQAGAEDQYYLALDPPYLAANQPLTDLAELALVRGYDGPVRNRLRPFVTVLPQSTAVNVNTAPPEVLAAIVEDLDMDGARALAARRETAYFRDRADFIGALPRGTTVAADAIAVNSNYFLSTLRVTIGSAESRGVALLMRGDAKWPVVLWRKYL